MGIRLVTYRGTGEAWDLTDHAEGLQWSNVNPGGDEQCSFQLKRQWFSGAPEIQQGNVVRVIDGLSVLWQGRVEENDRDVDATERIGVVAYGLGVRLKDNRMTEVYVDSDLGQFTEPSRARRVALLGFTYRNHGWSALPDTQSGLPALALNVRLEGNLMPRSEAWYDAGPDNEIASVYYDWVLTNVSTADANWRLLFSSQSQDDALGTSENGTNHAVVALTGSNTFTPATARRYMLALFGYEATTVSSAGTDRLATLRSVKLFGNHGLTKRGSAPSQGYWASDVITDIIGRVSGVTARRIDETDTVIPQLAFKKPTSHENAIVETNKFEGADWGTWGPDNALDTSLDGYFDYTARDTATAHWFARRSECDDLAIHVELATLFDQVDVHYRDQAGSEQIESRTRASRVLDEAGIDRTHDLDGGTLTQAGAQTLGDVFLAINAGESPGRGHVVLSQPVRHKDRGTLPPWFMRADGSNIRVPDVLPSRDVFDLSSAADRRTTFPIKRVSVDASGTKPVVRVEVDQANDTLSILQANLAAQAQLLGF